jgi:hypothetical protein
VCSLFGTDVEDWLMTPEALLDFKNSLPRSKTRQCATVFKNKHNYWVRSGSKKQRKILIPANDDLKVYLLFLRPALRSQIFCTSHYTKINSEAEFNQTVTLNAAFQIHNYGLKIFSKLAQNQGPQYHPLL